MHIEGHREPITEIGPDQPIGEIAFLTWWRAHGDRAGYARRHRHEARPRRFRQAGRGTAADLEILTTTLAQRLGAQAGTAPSRAHHVPRTIAVIGAGQSAVPSAFIAALKRVLGQSRDTSFVDAAAMAAFLPHHAAAESSEETQALNTLEAAHDCVVLLADAEPTQFSAKAIRHADLVLAVGLAGDDATPNALEQMAEHYLAPEARRLVLVHETRGLVQDTARWLAPRDIAMHHHVALSDDADVARLVRFIDGRAVGLISVRGRSALHGTHRRLQGAPRRRLRLRHHGRDLGGRGHDGGVCRRP